MRVAYSLGSLLSVPEALGCASAAAGLAEPPDSLWVPETWGAEAFAMAAAVAARAPGPRIGTSVVNAYSRSPALAAMGAATVDAASGGRLVLGVGAGGRRLVEGLHGAAFGAPLERVREYVLVVRALLSGRRVDHEGRFFRVRGFRLRARPAQARVPVYLAAVGPAMTDLCWEVADGALLYMRPLSELRETLPRMQARRRIEAACQVVAAVSDDAEAAARRAKGTVGFYVATGGAYYRSLASRGFASEARAIRAEYAASGGARLHELVPDRMARELAVFGTPDECRAGLERFARAGVDLPIVQFNPVGGAAGSFRLALEAFSGAGRR